MLFVVEQQKYNKSLPLLLIKCIIVFKRTSDNIGNKLETFAKHVGMVGITMINEQN